MFAVCLIFLGVTALVQSQPQYEVQLELPVGFFYRSGFLSQLADGTCCSPNETACHTSCNQTQITLCFRETSNNTDMNNCTLGEMTFITGAGSGIYTFSATGATTTTTYPGSYQLYYEISALHPIRSIESGNSTFNNSVNVQNDLVVLSGERTNLIFRAMTLVCKEGYFGPDCGSPCISQNDSTGHFTCGVNGAKVCLPGYQNPETNCVEEAPTEPTTTAQGGQASAVGVPMIVGGAVGGIVLLLLIILVIMIVAALIWRRRSKRQGKVRFEGNSVVFSSLQTDSPENSSENNNNGGAEATVPVMYTKVNKDIYTQREEAPPIIPYTGEPYMEVARTGLFATPGQRALPEIVMASSPGYAEVRRPQVVYADLNISKVRTQAAAQLSMTDSDNDVIQYSRVLSKNELMI